MGIFNLPELGEGLSEGEIISWRVKEGDPILAEAPLVDIMTDKATVEIPSPTSGKVKKLYYKVGGLAKVGRPLADIEEQGIETKSLKLPSYQDQEKLPLAPPQKCNGSNQQTHRVLASPVVRKMARDQGISLETIQGTGEHRRVLQSDLSQALSSAAPA